MEDLSVNALVQRAGQRPKGQGDGACPAQVCSAAGPARPCCPSSVASSSAAHRVMSVHLSGGSSCPMLNERRRALAVDICSTC
ncbi:hypothetical protein HU200_057311 [Digitaria exilis]|uniref:Uncharacterized protein n=1 Tax=Digitaria exilis TaxID=1010633 RepID=A0A835E042_9POAL|nr:hypothetical protein HU200_057311 [Digitaria exilis]